jgi:FtsZ-binding cell division protein ZapB
MWPIDMSVQELAKLERKREKNRHAAQKCRMLKLERISRLQQRVDELKEQNDQFANTSATLRDQVGKLRQLIVEHVEGGCQVMMVRSANLT